MSTILVVEDHATNRKLVRDLLEVKGHGVLEAVDAEHGLVLARSCRPDLVLMDIQLPGMNGIDALKALRADPVTAAIPVAAVTASVMQQDRTHIIAAGFDAFVAKPIAIREFLATVDSLLARGRS